MRDSDRYSLVVDLSGKAMTFFQYADDPHTHLPTCVAISSTTTATITSATSIRRHHDHPARYRDVNLAYAYRPADCEPEALRKKVMGALRYGKPLVLDYLSMELNQEAIAELFDAVMSIPWSAPPWVGPSIEPPFVGAQVMPGLLKLIISKEIIKEEHWSQLIKEGDDPDYAIDAWKSRNLEYFHFILVSKLPKLPEWCTDKFFILKVAG